MNPDLEQSRILRTVRTLITGPELLAENWVIMERSTGFSASQQVHPYIHLNIQEAPLNGFVLSVSKGKYSLDARETRSLIFKFRQLRGANTD